MTDSSLTQPKPPFRSKVLIGLWIASTVLGSTVWWGALAWATVRFAYALPKITGLQPASHLDSHAGYHQAAHKIVEVLVRLLSAAFFLLLLSSSAHAQNKAEDQLYSFGCGGPGPTCHMECIGPGGPLSIDWPAAEGKLVVYQ